MPKVNICFRRNDNYCTLHKSTKNCAKWMRASCWFLCLQKSAITFGEGCMSVWPSVHPPFCVCLWHFSMQAISHRVFIQISWKLNEHINCVARNRIFSIWPHLQNFSPLVTNKNGWNWVFTKTGLCLDIFAMFTVRLWRLISDDAAIRYPYRSTCLYKKSRKDW